MTADIVLTTPGLVHPILTEDQAELTHQALIAFLNSPVGSFSEHEVEESEVRKQLSELVYFFSEVVEHPEAFGLRTALETKRIIRQAKPVRGPMQPKSRRKRNQKNRMSFEKRTRRQRSEEAAAWNDAVQTMEAEKAEAEQIRNDEMKARIDRFETLLKNDNLDAEHVQELMDLLGYPQIAERARELRLANTTEARIAAAQARAEQNPTPED